MTEVERLRERLSAVRSLAEVVGRLQPADPNTGDRDVSWLELLEALDPSNESMSDLSVKSVLIAEVIDMDGRRFMEINTHGDPTTWDVLGMLAFGTESARRQVKVGEDD